MPSSPIHRFPLSDSSTNNNYECVTSIPSDYEEQEMDNMEKFTTCRFNHGNTLLHKQVERPIILQAHKSFGKRRYTFSGHQDHKVSIKKRRRVTSIALPTKFLLGGNINDPLNLSSLEDDNQQINVNHTSASSPLPLLPYRKQVQVAIPQNIHDPLNLTTGEAIKISHSSKSRKRRRHRKGKKDDENLDDGAQISPTEEVPPFDTTSHPELFLPFLDDCNIKETNTSAKIEFSGDQIASGKIVSPVIPQGSPIKTFKKSLSRSISKDVNEKFVSNLFQKRANIKSRKQCDTVKLRANAEKFCYGNHVTNMANWNFGCDYGIDPRLRFFNPELFEDKDILDIGCNTGQLTLHIARYWHPNKIVGIDIDKKLVDKAQQKVRFKLSEEIAVGHDFPEYMASMYGPLSKLVMSVSKSRREFPNNVTFFEANYVPASEDYLETQKPEFDTILCLRVTKWIHLNFGDEGLKMAFKRMFAQLRIGGHLILEFQPWFTYSTSKRITPAIYKTYQGLEMRPHSFCEYLLSEEVGFTDCQLIGRSYNSNKAYRQDIFLFSKGYPGMLVTPREYSQTSYCDIWSEYYSNFEDDVTSEFSE